ncbi:NlpC/P60 family protein [Nitratidesulfovibrio liaohensis]|uniref:C40 family peptidase n=1 Tax=Nitratidesulfovibrio liaohensis TaxID=2604158 RepID=A0ABY9QXY4_9BACT|nr:NlpC/P60 family protein [Nitratidesulfovibrio liaohensis]WMW64388.1 C40 family peptidase [Nitratidesulfovibrio liaohensis]
MPPRLPLSLSRNWTDAFIGIPFHEGGRDVSGCDCGGLVLLVLRELAGVHARDVTVDYGAEHFRGTTIGRRRLEASIASALAEWRPVRPGEVLHPLDMLQFNIGGVPCHLALHVGPRAMLHVFHGSDSAIENPDSPKWSSRLVEVWRHADLDG